MGNALLMSRTISGQRWPDEPEAAVPNRPDNLLQLESLVLEDLALLSVAKMGVGGTTASRRGRFHQSVCHCYGVVNSSLRSWRREYRTEEQGLNAAVELRAFQDKTCWLAGRPRTSTNWQGYSDVCRVHPGQDELSRSPCSSFLGIRCEPLRLTACPIAWPKALLNMLHTISIETIHVKVVVLR
jgi:hypothetical protein